MNRRDFLNYFGVSTLGFGIAACDNSPPHNRYNSDDVALLATQKEVEAKAAGNGPFGMHRYSGYRELAKLPWFELENDQSGRGRLICKDESVPMAIDMHAHLGMSVLFQPELDLQAKTKRVMHLLDCDGSKPCNLDLDIYINGNFREADLKKLERTIMFQGLWGSEIIRSHTIPNLLDEMSAMRVEKSVILPIKLDLPFGDDLTEQWRLAINKSSQGHQLLAGFSVHPLDSNCIDQMREYAKVGLKLMKLHPTVQRFYPDEPRVMKVYEEAQSLGVSVFFHGGRAGIEPDSSHRYAMPRHYKKALSDFPGVNFILGHAGARDVDAMLELMLVHENAWLDIHGQGVSKLDQIIDKTAGERILFGTDWPFYHIGSSLAKALIVTESNARQRHRFALLRGNALEFFDATGF